MSDIWVPFTTGPCLINWDGYNFGYAEDRVMMRHNPFWDLVHSDAYGGLAGPPADRQLMGVTIDLMALLTAFDNDVADTLHSFASSNYGALGEGDIPTVGSFARQDGLAGVLQLFGRNENRSFTMATLTGAQELNSSARHRRFQVAWTAEVDDACNLNLLTITRPGTNPCTLS